MSERTGKSAEKPTTVYQLEELENATTTDEVGERYDAAEHERAVGDTESTHSTHETDKTDSAHESVDISALPETDIDLDNLTYKQKLELGGEFGVERIRRLQAEKAAESQELDELEQTEASDEEKARFQARLEYGSSDLFDAEREAFVAQKLAENAGAADDEDDAESHDDAPDTENDPSSTVDDNEAADAPASPEEQRTALQEQLFMPGSLAAWRKELAQELSLHNVNDDEQAERMAADFLAGKLEPFEDSGLLTPALREQLMIFLMTDEADFQAYQEEYDRTHGLNSEDRSGESHYPITLRLSTRIKNRWDSMKDRLFGEDNPNAKRNKRRAWGIGAVAVATGMYATWKWGLTDGLEEVPDAEPDATPEAEPDTDPEAPTPDEPETDYQDLSAELGLPEHYLIETPEGYVATAMEGSQTDSIWRAAEHALQHYLEREPSTTEINNLQNMIGDHWLEVGEKVNISESLIEQSLSRAA